MAVWRYRFLPIFGHVLLFLYLYIVLIETLEPRPPLLACFLFFSPHLSTFSPQLSTGDHGSRKLRHQRRAVHEDRHSHVRTGWQHRRECGQRQQVTHDSWCLRLRAMSVSVLLFLLDSFLTSLYLHSLTHARTSIRTPSPPPPHPPHTADKEDSSRYQQAQHPPHHLPVPLPPTTGQAER